jgi:two-component system sensor histidine kinase/response regulator
MNLNSAKSFDPARFGEDLRDSINKRSDKLIEIFLVSYFVVGLILANFYDTWLIAFSVGALNLALYFLAKKMFPNSVVHHYTASLVVGIFMAQFIYQMHGLFEMHFFAFVGAALMITYQNWKTQIPLTLFVVAHHAVFGYIQYTSYMANEENTIYFTQLNYMDLQTFIIHVILAAVIIFICGLWAYDSNKRTDDIIANTKNIMAVAEANDSVAQNLEYAMMLSNGAYAEEISYKEGDLMGEALSAIQKKLRGTNG